MLFIFAHITVNAVGDVMLGSITPRRRIPPDSGRVFVESVKDYLSGAHVVFGNLEGTFIKKGMRPVKCSEASRRAGRCYEFGMPHYLAWSLKAMGFNVMSLDNNHSLDYGWKAYRFTHRLLDSLGIRPVGKKEYVIFDVDSIRVAVVAFGFGGTSWHIRDVEKAKEIVRELDEKADIVIVSFHGGAEGRGARHTRDRTERFYGENRGNVVRFARGVVDAGADLVIGHGPHVLRAIELYKGRLIAYSLGNFLTYGNISIRGYGGITAILSVVLDREGKFVSGRIIPFVQRPPGVPVYDPKGRGIKAIKELTESDFPNTAVVIEEDGRIRLAE